jgi:hypothetical protein
MKNTKCLLSICCLIFLLGLTGLSQAKDPFEPLHHLELGSSKDLNLFTNKIKFGMAPSDIEKILDTKLINWEPEINGLGMSVDGVKWVSFLKNDLWSSYFFVDNKLYRVVHEVSNLATPAEYLTLISDKKVSDSLWQEWKSDDSIDYDINGTDFFLSIKRRNDGKSYFSVQDEDLEKVAGRKILAALLKRAERKILNGCFQTLPLGVKFENSFQDTIQTLGVKAGRDQLETFYTTADSEILGRGDVEDGYDVGEKIFTYKDAKLPGQLSLWFFEDKLYRVRYEFSNVDQKHDISFFKPFFGDVKIQDSEQINCNDKIVWLRILDSSSLLDVTNNIARKNIQDRAENIVRRRWWDEHH